MSPEVQQNFLQWAKNARWLRRQAKRGPTVFVASAPSQAVIVNVVEGDEGPQEVAVNWAGIWVGRGSIGDDPDFVKSLHAHAKANLMEDEEIVAEISRWLYPR